MRCLHVQASGARLGRRRGKGVTAEGGGASIWVRWQMIWLHNSSYHNGPRCSRIGVWRSAAWKSDEETLLSCGLSTTNADVRGEFFDCVGSCIVFDSIMWAGLYCLRDTCEQWATDFVGAQRRRIHGVLGHGWVSLSIIIEEWCIVFYFIIVTIQLYAWLWFSHCWTPDYIHLSLELILGCL